MGHGKIVAVPVGPEQIDEWRGALRWHFDSFCQDGGVTPEDLWLGIAEKRRQLWVATGYNAQKPLAAVLTTISDDRLQTCVMTHAAGKEMRSWLHLWDEIENWAKSIGCKRIEAIARPGWERILKDMKKTHVVLEKRL